MEKRAYSLLYGMRRNWTRVSHWRGDYADLPVQPQHKVVDFKPLKYLELIVVRKSFKGLDARLAILLLRTGQPKVQHADLQSASSESLGVPEP